MISIQSPARRALWVMGPAIAIALLFVLLFAGQAWLQSLTLGIPFAARRLWIALLTRWLLFAALTPVIALLVVKRPIAVDNLRSRALLHAALATGIAALHSVLTGVIYKGLHAYPAEDSLAEAIGRLLMAHSASNLIVILAISGAFHAIRHHQTVQARDRLAAALSARLVEARLEALRAQLNPHFLFNTLNAVSGLALSGRPEQVASTLSRLAEVLRISLDPNLPQEVPLARELEILEPYLELQRIRFGDRLIVDSDVATDTHAALFPSMMLQPLVENALQYGLARRPGPGRVTLSAQRHESMLRLRVEDDGPGFAPATRESTDHGIGLANTRARLAELHADAHAVTIGNNPAGGAFVQIDVPFRSEPTGRLA